MCRIAGDSADTEAAFAGAQQRPDPHSQFAGPARVWADVDLPEVVGTATDGYVGTIHGHVRGNALQLGGDKSEDNPLTGPVFQRCNLDRPPRNLTEFRSMLTHRQREHLDAGLAARAAAGQNETSGGHDHAVLVWPRDGMLDVLVLSFSGSGPTLKAHSHRATCTDAASRLRRAGPDAPTLVRKSVLLAGVGAVGGHAALALAHSGLGHLTVHDDGDLDTLDTIRHVLSNTLVGHPKTVGLHVRLDGTAPWCEVVVKRSLPFGPPSLARHVRGHDLVVDCTGIEAMTTVLAQVAAAEKVPLLSGSLYHRGAVVRTRRQAPGDTLLWQRANDGRYVPLPPEPAEPRQPELGGTAPVQDVPPAAVLRAAADIAAAAIDLLTGRRLLPDETITVLAPVAAPRFDVLGPVSP